MQEADVVIIGGGAAGLMCAIAVGSRGRRAVVLEGSNKIGKKILMSGGGRCNFTNLNSSPDKFISGNPHFCKSALSQYSQWDFIALVEKHGIPYHEKTLGQLFCDNSSKDIVAMLADECRQHRVSIHTHCNDATVEYGDRFIVRCSEGIYRCESLVIASGGLSIPKMGASDFGYRIARQFGHEVTGTSAGLVPFTLTGTLHELSTRLSGVSCLATVTAGGVSFTEAILFTHRGLSGPAILQASSYWRPGEAIEIDLLPDIDLAERLLFAKKTRPKVTLKTVLAGLLPKALASEIVSRVASAEQESPLAEIADDALRAVAAILQKWSVKPAATEGYRTAEVTLGGIDTAELSSRTLESKRQPGLYFIGEVVDVTGHLGGYNFQWAWSSGQAAGRVA